MAQYSLATYHIARPGWVVALFNSLEQGLNTVVGVLTRKTTSLGLRQRLSTAILQEMDLNVVEFAILVDELKRVAGVSMHVVVTVRVPAVGEENHDLVDRLRVEGEIVLQATGFSLALQDLT